MTKDNDNLFNNNWKDKSFIDKLCTVAGLIFVGFSLCIAINLAFFEDEPNCSFMTDEAIQARIRVANIDAYTAASANSDPSLRLFLGKEERDSNLTKLTEEEVEEIGDIFFEVAFKAYTRGYLRKTKLNEEIYPDGFFYCSTSLTLDFPSDFAFKAVFPQGTSQKVMDTTFYLMKKYLAGNLEYTVKVEGDMAYAELQGVDED